MNRPSSFFSNFALGALLGLAGLAQASGQSLWKEGVSYSVVADRSARSVGDVVTILVQENTASAKQNNTKTSRESDIDAAIKTFFYSTAAGGLMSRNGTMPALKMNSKSTFDGGGQINNNENITARITVKVSDVLPNGNLLVEGRRQTKISGETTDAVLRGTIRPEDISPNNTVFSYNVADATIQFFSKGVLTDSQRKGWFLRLWDKIAPF